MADTHDFANLRIAVVGAGLVGRGWAVVFARAGFSVRMYDADADVLAVAPVRIQEQLRQLERYRLLKEPAEAVMGRIAACDSLEAAVSGAGYVQESILERVEFKRELLRHLQTLDDGGRIVGSSTSGIPASHFAQGLAIASRVMIVHPVNPPSLVPLVELVPSPETDGRTVQFVRDLMDRVGQTAILVRKEIEGFVLNRLQAVLLREAWALVEDGVASVEDVDKTVRDGLGWRWSFMGPFETIHLNAVGGVADYARRLGPLYQRIAESRRHERPWTRELAVDVEGQLLPRIGLEDLVSRCQWRDEQLMAFARHRAESSGDAGPD